MVGLAIYNADNEMIGIKTLIDDNSVARNINSSIGEKGYKLPESSYIMFPINFDKVREYYKNWINSVNSKLRQNSITGIFAQDYIYREKQEEAERWVEGDPETDYPFIHKEAVATGQSFEDVRLAVLTRADAVRDELSTLDSERHRLLKAVSEASDDIRTIALASEIYPAE